MSFKIATLRYPTVQYIEYNPENRALVERIPGVQWHSSYQKFVCCTDDLDTVSILNHGDIIILNDQGQPRRLTAEEFEKKYILLL